MAAEMSRQRAERIKTEYRQGPSGWADWIIFAAVMLILVGVLNAIHGFVAIVNDEWVVWTNRADLYLDLTTWGWVHIAIGIALVLTGLGVLKGNVLARTIAVVVAGFGIITNFLYLPAFPLWSLTIIAINVFVIFALTAHGRDLAPPA
jgi:hypothetical protein